MKYTTSISIIFAIFCSIGSSLAQTSTGVVVGRVFDENQAVLSGAEVVLKNIGTGAERRARTNAHRDYIFVAAQPGRYTITATSAGFAPATATLDVAIAASTRVDLTLGVQGAQEDVAVVGGNGIAVQTRDAQLGFTINERLITSLPTLNTSLYTQVYGSPGATAGFSGRGIDVSVSGQRLSSGNFILDGGENNDVFVGAPAQDVPRDAVQEMRVQTNNFQSEYGRNSGFIVNVVTKSGSNAFHGSAYWFNVNSALAANSFSNNANGLKRPVFNTNQFSLAAGGPIRKDRLFFFGSFLPDIRRTSSQDTFFVPTPDSPIPLFQAKARSETYLRSSGLPYTILAPDVFMDVWIPMIVAGPALSGHPVTIIGEGRRKHSFIAAGDVAAFAIASIGHPAAMNHHLPLGGPEAVSWRDVVVAFERVLGREIPVVSLTPGQPLPGLPEIIGHLMAGLEMYDSVIEMSETAKTFGVKQTSLEDFARGMLSGAMAK